MWFLQAKGQGELQIVPVLPLHLIARGPVICRTQELCFPLTQDWHSPRICSEEARTSKAPNGKELQLETNKSPKIFVSL